MVTVRLSSHKPTHTSTKFPIQRIRAGPARAERKHSTLKATAPGTSTDSTPRVPRRVVESPAATDASQKQQGLVSQVELKFVVDARGPTIRVTEHSGDVGAYAQYIHDYIVTSFLANVAHDSTFLITPKHRGLHPRRLT